MTRIRYEELEKTKADRAAHPPFIYQTREVDDDDGVDHHDVHRSRRESIHPRLLKSCSCPITFRMRSIITNDDYDDDEDLSATPDNHDDDDVDDDGILSSTVEKRHLQ